MSAESFPLQQELAVGPRVEPHAWPLPGEHFWSKWQNEKGLPNPTQYRTCIHPDCNKVERRDAPRA